VEKNKTLKFQLWVPNPDDDQGKQACGNDHYKHRAEKLLISGENIKQISQEKFDGTCRKTANSIISGNVDNLDIKNLSRLESQSITLDIAIN